MIREKQNYSNVKYELVLFEKKKKETLKNDTHPLYDVFVNVASERSGGMRLSYAKTNRHRILRTICHETL